MINEPNMKESLGRVTDIASRITGDVIIDYSLLYEMREKLKSPHSAAEGFLPLSYLLLFHPSALIRHEAAFLIGEYVKVPVGFLKFSALHDENAVVRHEACLALASKYQNLNGINVSILRYISENDKDQMVRESALIALAKINIK